MQKPKLCLEFLCVSLSVLLGIELIFHCPAGILRLGGEFNAHSCLGRTHANAYGPEVRLKELGLGQNFVYGRARGHQQHRTTFLMGEHHIRE